ncbi:hypothetical protein DH2020_025597 [Rehmannia glutinosa]|uniref:NB-ARC domain-containing protein n=1 Tax=Rehmannia glutinosa TaxID=99300 RepID=A0ABR0VZA9_REHGL
MGNTASSSTGSFFQDTSNGKPINWLQPPKDTTKWKSKPVFISNQSLSDIREIILWRSQPDLIHQEAEVSWTVSHITAVLHYVLKLEGISVSEFIAQRRIDEAWGPKREPIHKKRMTKMFLSFTHDFRKFLEVPKLHHDLSYQNNNKNEILAAFMDFLLQLLYDRTTWMYSFEDRIESLEKELRFLITVLGDTPFIVENLLAEFETVANYAGSLVHSLVFLSVRVFKSIRIDKELDTLLKRIHLLKFNISKFSNMLPPFISNAAAMTPTNTVPVDSLFIVDSLLYDLNDLMYREGGPIVDVKDQIELLHQGLMLSKSLLNGVKMPPNLEIQETVTRIRQVSYEAEYLISSFLSGNAPLWYFTVRLTHVIHKIKLIETLLQEIRKNYDIGALNIAEEFKETLLIDILISLKSEADKNKILELEDEDLLESIYKSLKGRRYLIVVDDIWSSNVWDDLRRCFPDDGNGSRILFTSRNKDVAPPNTIINTLPSLSNDQCWDLLEKKVFHNDPCPPKLVEIGKEIAAKCCGLPLAVVVIAEISARKLTRLWVAEGFIRKEETKSAESVAEEYLMELIDKSLVMVAKRRWDGGVKACIIHDLLRDLCLEISKQATFVKLVDSNCSIYQKGQHLISLQDPLTPFFGHHVRSFHAECPGSAFYLGSMNLLRVLDFKIIFNHTRLIGTEFLINLRYLVINGLPASISSLVNLEYLRVERIFEGYADIPLVILKMVRLRHLHVTPAGSFEEDCYSSHTNNLEVLSNVSILKLEDEEMLKCSPHLRKLKCKCEPLLVEENGISQYRYPDLRFLTQLQSLEMTEINFYRGKMSDSNFHGGKMAEINFPSTIKKLTMFGWRWPWEKMSIIGRLPNLEVLKLRHSAFVGEIWDTRDNEFEQLRFLKLENLDITQWNVASSEHFPSLRRLILYSCDNLEEIPFEIGEIATLELIEVQGKCRKSLVESARQIEEQQREIGNEELSVIIRHIYEPYD